ncbi:hypothetical protein PIROE2DRAFT_6448 [Piromyces sp. E2]|nr:hypothetical protein PIROE2DRAFT_6448 [Piromyces sp. E2]|eukprot:OUM66314.1 hypothetical protein PIROE2DRAFT_6448 [Piromyces sp. E2]
MSSELNIKKEGDNSIDNKSNGNFDKDFSSDRNKDENKKETEPIRRRSTRVRRSIIPEQTMKHFLEVTGKYNMKNISKNQSEILNQLFEQEPIFIDDTLSNAELNIEKTNELFDSENKNEIDDDKLKHKDSNKHNKHKEVKNHDQKTLNDYNIGIISSKSDKLIEKEPNKRRSTRKRHPVIPENTLRDYLEITGDFDNTFNQQQSQILEQFDEQSSLSTYLSESTHIDFGDNKLNKENERKSDGISNTDSKSNTYVNTLNSPNINEENENKEKMSVKNTNNNEKLKREGGSDSEMEFHQRRSKRVRHSVIPESKLKEYLKITSELSVKHHQQRGRHKKHDINGSNLSSDDIEDIEKEKIRLENRRRREKKIQERFYNYDFMEKTDQDEFFNDDKPIENQEHQSNTQEKKKNSISDYYKINGEAGKDKILKIEDKLNKEYENVKVDNSKNEISMRVKNKIKPLKKKISKKEEKQYSFNSIDSMFMKNNEKSNSDNVKNNEGNTKEKIEKIFPIFNSKRKSSISTENSISTSQTVNDSHTDDSKSNENKEKSSLGINETQPLSIIETDSFFLTSKQKQWKMQKLNQQKLRKDLEESYKFHSSFAQGKAIHTFFQLARSSSRQNSGTSLASSDSSLNVSKSFSENIEYPATFMEAAYPTSWNNHVYNNNNNINNNNSNNGSSNINKSINNNDIVINNMRANDNAHSQEESNDALNKQDSMNICLSPSRTSSTIDLGNIYGINDDSQNTDKSLEEMNEDQSSYIDVDDDSDSDDNNINDSDDEDDNNNNSILNTQESQTSVLEEQTSSGVNILENIQDTNLLSSPVPIDSSSYIESSSSTESSSDDDESDSDTIMSSQSDDVSVTSNSVIISFNEYKFNKKHPQCNFLFDSEDMNNFLISIINNKELLQVDLFERMEQISKNKVNNSNDVSLRFSRTLSEIDFNQFLTILFPTNKTAPWNHFKDFAYSNNLLRKYVDLCISPNKLETYPKFMDYIYPDAIWTEKYSPKCSNQVLSNKSQADEIINWLNNWKIGKTEEPISPTEPEVVEVTTTTTKRGRKKHHTETTYHPEDDEFMGYYDYNYVNYYENLFSTPTVESKGDKFLFLVGPPASGKSSTIQACALECGFEILEIYPGIKRSGKDITNIIGDLTQSHIVMSMDKSLHSPKRKGSTSFPSFINPVDSNKESIDVNSGSNPKSEQVDNQNTQQGNDKKIQQGDNQNIVSTGDEESITIKDDESNNKKDRGRPKKTAITEADTQKNLINNYFGKKRRKLSDDVTNNSKKESDKVIIVNEHSPISNEDKNKGIIEIENKPKELKVIEKDKINDNPMKIDKENSTITIDDDDHNDDDKNENKNNGKSSSKKTNKHNQKINRIQTDGSKTDLTTLNKNTVSSPTAPQNLTNLLIVFEEVDILMDQDKGFWASVYNIIKSTKRPIMFTGNENILKNELMQIPPNLYLSLSIQNYNMPKIEDVTTYVFYLCLLEEHLIDPRDIISLCQLFNNDIRKIINQLQFRLLKTNKDIKNIKDEKENPPKDEVIIIDLDDDDKVKETGDDQKNNQSIEMKKEIFTMEKSLDNLNIKQDNEKSTSDTVMSPTGKEIIMEHLSLDQIIGIDLNLINIYNYYLRHHMRPDLALVRTIPNFVLLPKYDQMQCQLEEICKEENELYYSSLNKLYEAEVQQLTALNNNYHIDIFDEWSINDRGGVLTWIIRYKKGTTRKTNKIENNNTINDLLSPSSSVMSSPGLRPLTDFSNENSTGVTSSKKKVAIMDYFISDKKVKKKDSGVNDENNKIIEDTTINNDMESSSHPLNDNKILKNNQSVSAYTIDEYTTSWGATCPMIEFKKSDYIEEIRNLGPVTNESCMSVLEKVSSRLEKSNSEVANLIPIVHDLVAISNVLSREKSRHLMSFCFNILTRAALAGNLDAMYGLTTTSFTPTKEEVSKILSVKGIESLDYGQVQDALSQKLEEDESDKAFLEVLKEVKHKSMLLSGKSNQSISDVKRISVNTMPSTTNSQGMNNTDSTTFVDLTTSSPPYKPIQPILIQDKEEEENNKSEFSSTIQNSNLTRKTPKEKDYRDLLLLRALSDYETTISDTDAFISMSDDRRFQLFEIDSYGPCKDDCIGYSSICKENIKRDSPQFCVSNNNYEETLNNYFGSENHLCAWVNTLAKHHLFSEVENICHSEQLSKLYSFSPLAVSDQYLYNPGGDESNEMYGEMLSTHETPHKDNSMMSTSPFSNDLTSSSVITDQVQDPNQSILYSYLDTQMMQTLQMNHEIISMASPSPSPLPIATTTTPLPPPLMVPMEITKESFVDPISVSTPPPLPNLPSNLPIMTESTVENEMKIASPPPPPPLPPPSMTNIISTQPFIYKHKNKGKFKSKKIFDTISKKTCYWPTWIEEKR